VKKLILPLALLSVAPLAAQSFEVGVFVGQQSYKSASDIGGTLEPSKKTVTSARFGYSVVDFGPALFQLTAGYQPESKTDVEANGVTIPGSEFKQKHWSVGAMFNFKAGVAIGAGIEYRNETLTSGPDSTTYGRPWARANVGFAFPTPLVKPFIGLEVAAPMTSKSYDSAASDAENLKAVAPKMQVGIYAGLRF
jgi:predicted porin